ncbi:PREDICTED: transmembrane protein 223 [Lepidothrix coronata]|uniref:Transmembrane protein 223 n=1 Tax=Lepidothrix coronata TaxID=321398 RepID=A0A6J0G722_9PASS|nr:PREDICTED: transmembrane protein 223 [Lepidothrix coronata]
MAARVALEAAVPRDVVLFSHDRSRFFRLAGLFCASQGLFWAYLAHLAFTVLRPQPGPGPDEPQDPLRPRDNKWRFGFTASCLTIGSLTVAAGCLFPLRAVRRVTLLRGGSQVTLQTYGPLGWGRGATLTVPLRDVSARAHRAEAAAAVPVRVRGRPFFFLLDKRGVVGDPRLFDLTVGAYRKF